MPPTRGEQLQLDELLSDLYRGIETLPGKENDYSVSSNDKSKRRVRIVDYSYKSHHDDIEPVDVVDQQQQLHPQWQPQPQSQSQLQTQAQSQAQSQVQAPGSRGQSSQGRVKYVNTNKLIYHQEKNPDDEDSDENNNNHHEADDDDDVDGVTRVEYYHTTWLDRQLGRASKRRSSKELNERQNREKAMIEELKRSLKNGAITLRQSLRGNKHKQHNKSSAIFDDQVLNSSQTNSATSGNRKFIKDSASSSVFGSGLATTPRNYHHNNKSSKKLKQQQQQQPQQELSSSYTPKQTSAPQAARRNNTINPIASEATSQPQTAVQTHRQQQQQQAGLLESHYSRTLPHNYHQQTPQPQQHQQQQPKRSDSIMRNPNYINNCVNPNNTIGSPNQPIKSPSNYPYNQQLLLHQPQQQRTGETISSIPSATEVVRSALSRSGSQVSLNQLNKTINLLPNSPPPYGGASPMTPTQQLRAASPSLSPSPIGMQQRQICAPSPQYSSKTLGTPASHQHQHQQQQQLQQHLQPGQVRVSGTRTLERPSPQPAAPATGYQPQKQQVYANPHASLMQHRTEQQMKQPNRNVSSIREFNELDSLLRSLSPGVTTHVTPGYNSRPTQATFGGYGYSPSMQPQSQQQQQNQQQLAAANLNQSRANAADVYARVQKNPSEQSKASYLQQHYSPSAVGNTTSTTHQPFTIDVTNKKDDNCLQRQNLSEFEPPTELLPSMEDYQNISKLNPVKNHYWYKPNMSRDRAINLLKDKPQGTFIVRDSNSFKGAFGLAVKVSKLPRNVLQNANLRNPNGDPSAELIRHFLIEPTGDGGVRLKGYANEPVFSSLANLIYQHSLTELALPCKLVIPRADIEDPKFNMRQKQYYDEFLASKEQAKHNPYDATSPNGGYRKYPGDVYVHNEHRIIFE